MTFAERLLYGAALYSANSRYPTLAHRCAFLAFFRFVHGRAS